MFNSLLKMSSGIEELTFFGGLLGFLLFLLSKHIKMGLKLTAVCLLMFFITWRLEFSRFHVMSSRYVSGLIIPSLLFAVYFFCKVIKITKTNKCVAIILVTFLLTNYIKDDLKYNKYDASYYAIAEIAKRCEIKKEKREFLIESKDYERILFLCNTNNVSRKSGSSLQYINNFGYSYFPEIVDIISNTNNNITLQNKQKLIGSFSLNRNSNKKINLIATPPKVSLTTNPTLTSLDYKDNLLHNGSIEEIDTPKQSHRKLVNLVSDYNLYYEYDESVRTPKNGYFQVESGSTYKVSLGVESASPINGNYSVSIKVNNGDACFFFDQGFFNGFYRYSFLIKGKKGALVQSYYSTYFNKKWKATPICSFIVPDSQTYLISVPFDIDGLKEADFFMIGVRAQNGEALFDDFVLTRRNNNKESAEK